MGVSACFRAFPGRTKKHCFSKDFEQEKGEGEGVREKERERNENEREGVRTTEKRTRERERTGERWGDEARAEIETESEQRASARERERVRRISAAEGERNSWSFNGAPFLGRVRQASPSPPRNRPNASWGWPAT